MERVECTKQALAGLAPELLKIHQKIWAYAEPSSAEVQSAKLLCEVLRQKGFAVEENVCGRPTAFIATFGAGHPVVGYLGEYDALPGLSQQAGRPQHCPRLDRNTAQAGEPQDVRQHRKLAVAQALGFTGPAKGIHQCADLSLLSGPVGVDQPNDWHYHSSVGIVPAFEI